MHSVINIAQEKLSATSARIFAETEFACYLRRLTTYTVSGKEIFVRRPLNLQSSKCRKQCTVCLLKEETLLFRIRKVPGKTSDRLPAMPTDNFRGFPHSL